MARAKSLLCYGDSNTWGTIPMKRPGDFARFDPDQRWPGVVRGELGQEWLVIEEGLPGRTTDLDPADGAYKNGLSYLVPCIESHRPLDAVIIALGVNDLQAVFNRRARDIAFAAERLVDCVRLTLAKTREKTKILVITPPPISESTWTGEIFLGGAEKSKEFARYFGNIPNRTEAQVLDAGSCISCSADDGIHYELDAHRALGAVVARKVIDL